MGSLLSFCDSFSPRSHRPSVLSTYKDRKFAPCLSPYFLLRLLVFPLSSFDCVRKTGLATTRLPCLSCLLLLWCFLDSCKCQASLHHVRSIQGVITVFKPTCLAYILSFQFSLIVFFYDCSPPIIISVLGVVTGFVFFFYFSCGSALPIMPSPS